MEPKVDYEKALACIPVEDLPLQVAILRGLLGEKEGFALYRTDGEGAVHGMHERVRDLVGYSGGALFLGMDARDILSHLEFRLQAGG